MKIEGIYLETCPINPFELAMKGLQVRYEVNFSHPLEKNLQTLRTYLETSSN